MKPLTSLVPPSLALSSLALCCALLGGCTLDPAYKRPAPSVPSSFPQGPSYAPPAGEAVVPTSWRAVFTDADLQAVIDQALANNRDLRVAVASIASAQAQTAVQRSALFPAVNGSAGETYQQAPNTFVPGGGTFQERLYSASIGFSSWELDLFGRTRSLTRAAYDQFLASEDNRRAVQMSLIAQVATDWFTYAADADLLRVAQETLKAQQASLDLTRARFNGGVASELDVRQAETTVEQARSDVANFTTTLAQARNALDLVVGVPVAEARLPGALPAAGVAEVKAGLNSQVLLTRPDVLQAEHELQSANANIGAARAAFFPQIGLTGQVGQESTALQSLFDTASRTWLFSPSVTVPIFAGGRNVGNLKAAEAQRDTAVAQYEKAVQSAFRDVADALARQGTIGEQLAAQQALVNSASQALTLTNARYERGTDPYLNVLVAQRTLYTAQQSLITTNLTRLTNAVSLYRALGGGQT
ncbi:MAG TPA: efflux transporter outer membrane subunit [Caulobacteraceae bacterium]